MIIVTKVDWLELVDLDCLNVLLNSLPGTLSKRYRVHSKLVELDRLSKEE